MRLRSRRRRDRWLGRWKEERFPTRRSVNRAVRRVALPSVTALASTGTTVIGLIALSDRRRRHMAMNRTAATVRRGTRIAERSSRHVAGYMRGLGFRASEPLRHADREYDDVTLARKVESELFRPDDAPKGSVNVNARHGVVELRGEVKRPEQVRELGDAAARVAGVKEVHNLLHTPGSPPKHSPPRDPEEVREQAEQSTP